MRIRSIAAVAVAALLVAACKTTTATSTVISGTPTITPAPVPAAAATPASEVDPTGRWVLSLEAQGQTLAVVLELVKTPDGGYGGSLSSEYFPTIPITKGTLVGKRLTLSYPVPTGGDGSMYLDIDGNVASGEWAAPGMGSRVSGERR